jgi:hypothetical protein
MIAVAAVSGIAATVYLYSRGQYVGEFDFTQTNALEFKALGIEDVKNNTPSQMNLTTYNSGLQGTSADYCQTEEERENGMLPLGDPDNPIMIKRGHEEFLNTQFCIYSVENYYRKMYIVAKPGSSLNDNLMAGEGLTVEIEPQSLEIPAWYQPEPGSDSYKQLTQLMAYEKTIEVNVKADAQTEPGLHHFTIEFLEPNEYRRASEPGSYSVIGKLVYVNVRD